MIIKKIRFLIFIILTFCYCAPRERPEGLPVYHCYKTSEEIIIDGNITEDAWKKAEEAQFVNFDGSVPEQKTTFKWLWDDVYLYGAFHVEDKDIWSTKTVYDDSLWLEEV
ncbi:MAG: hypothetical protein HWN67_22105, partial [Candidatus Helarchaeota archaeon]|nr:hypothetical protein [Candidatus Helarchaeota archaeon]